MKRSIIPYGIFALMLSGTGFILPVHASTVVQEVLQRKGTIEVRGTVTGSDGPIIGATIMVHGTKTATVTDVNGQFTIQVPVGSRLDITCVGYMPTSVVCKTSKPLQVEMKEDATTLQGVQVIAYGTTKKVTVTGAISSVNQEDLLKAPVANMGNALAGKVTGLSSIQMSGAPGADSPTLFIRGVGSLSTGLSSPLILVDGVERSFFQLDPNEVDNITVLKDASATAVFGVRGANGVILVTTKRGSKGKAKISFSATTALQFPTRLPEYEDSYRWATAYNGAQLHDGVSEDQLMFNEDDLQKYKDGSSPLTHPSTDWVDMLIRKASLQMQYNFNISGGSDRVKYFASIGAFTQDGFFKTFHNANDKGFRYNRYNYRLNLDLGLTSTTNLKVNVGGYLNNRQEPNYNNGSTSTVSYLFRDIYTATPFSGAGIVDGKRIRVYNSKFTDVQDALNVYYGKGYNTYANNVLNFDMQLTQQLDAITKGLSFHIKGAYNSGVSIYKRREGRMPAYEAYLKDGEVQLKLIQEYQKIGYSESDGLSRNWYLEGAFNYKRDFGPHHVSALAMYNQTMKYYPAGSYPGIPRSYVGFVGRATYDYKTRYLADFSMGYNGSENFAKGHRYGFFPAGSLGWILSEEGFFKPLKKAVGYLKLRASLGKVGNDLTSDSSRFLYLPSTYYLSSGNYSFGVTTGSKIPGAAEGKLGNPLVTWETSVKTNLGADMKLIKNQLTINFDYFIEHRKNILISRGVIPGYLAVSLPTVNMGKVDNHGYEINVRWDSHVRDFRYYVGASLSYARNKIIYMDEVKYPYEWMQRTGKPVSQNFGYVTDGYFSEEDVKNYESLKGKEGGIPDQGSGYIPLAGDVKYKDLNGDGKIDEKDVRDIGYPMYPLYSMGINMGFSYKGFDLSMTWSGAFKTSRMLSSTYLEPFGPSNNFSLMKYMVDDAWTPEKGNSAKAPALSFRSKGHNYMSSDLWLRNASYLRLKNIELGYSLPRSVTQKLHVSSLRVSLSGYNLLTFDKLKVCDPETNPNGTAYPMIKILNFGLRIGI